MAKIKYLLDVTSQFEDFQGDFDLTVKSNGKEATWENAELGSKVVVEGTKLAAADEGDHFDAGKITGLTVYNGDEKIVVSISGLKLDAADLSAAFLDGGLNTALYMVTAGNDTVTGTKKDEFLFSGGGSDVLTGKGGTDTFSFHEVSDHRAKGGNSGEHDVITDFDAKGSDADMLIFDQDFTSKSVHKNHDTQVTFDDGSTLVLEGVTKKQFLAYVDSHMDM